MPNIPAGSCLILCSIMCRSYSCFCSVSCSIRGLVRVLNISIRFSDGRAFLLLLLFCVGLCVCVRVFIASLCIVDAFASMCCMSFFGCLEYRVDGWSPNLVFIARPLYVMGPLYFIPRLALSVPSHCTVLGPWIVTVRGYLLCVFCRDLSSCSELECSRDVSLLGEFVPSECVRA